MAGYPGLDVENDESEGMDGTENLLGSTSDPLASPLIPVTGIATSSALASRSLVCEQLASTFAGPLLYASASCLLAFLVCHVKPCWLLIGTHVISPEVQGS